MYATWKTHSNIKKNGVSTYPCLSVYCKFLLSTVLVSFSFTGANISMCVPSIALTACGILQPVYSAKAFIAVACSNVVKGNLINSDDTRTNSM